MDRLKTNDVSKASLSGVSFSLRVIAHAAAAVGCALVVLAVAQPIWTDDIWWHLALGERYLAQGPWLTRDPLLFTALGPPPPTSWLMDVGLRAIWNIAGFSGLRIFHLGLVIAILTLVWVSLRRAGRSPAIASVGTAFVAILSTYRLVQLRPHLGTIVAALLLHWILFSKPEIPSWRRVFASVAIIGIWANVHPVYPIGPVLVAAAIVGLVSSSILESAADGVTSRARAVRFAWVFVFGIAATFLNPSGIEGYARAISAGMGSDSVAIVVDEWSRFQLMVWPTASLPPSRLNWVCAWLLIASVPSVAAHRQWTRWRGDDAAGHSVDPALVALAVTGLVAMLLATRFAWMAFWPVLLLASATRGATRIRSASASLESSFGLSLGLAFCALALAIGFYRWGDWPMVTRGLPATLAGFREPYAAGKYHTQAVSFMRDAKLEGNLFGRYAEGGFQAFWLGPAVRTAMNGSLNMANEALASSFAIRERIGTPSHPRFEEALDELGVDLFLGTGLPMETRPGRPPNYSTIHLEDTSGWILVFRNLDSALYVRINERNASNLEKVVDYYHETGIPYDRALGFQPRKALRAAPEWSKEHGLWTPLLGAKARSPLGASGLGPMSMAYLALGMYDEAGAANEALLRIDPVDVSALRRRAWLLLRPGRPRPRDELVKTFRALSRTLSGHSSPGGPTQELLSILKSAIDGQSTSASRTQVVPVLTRAEAHRLLHSMNPAGPLHD